MNEQGDDSCVEQPEKTLEERKVEALEQIAEVMPKMFGVLFTVSVFVGLSFFWNMF